MRVLTLNAYDVPLVSKDREKRIGALCSRLAANQSDPSMRFDMIALQEVFCNDSRAAVEEAAARGGLAHFRHFLSGTAIPMGARGCGCTVLSMHPIETSSFYRFAVNGFPENIHHWDFQAGKGIGLCRIAYPEYPVDFYATHLIGEYTEGANDGYCSHRVLQAAECAAFINITARQEAVVILAGDLNAIPSSPCLTALIELAALRDCFVECNTDTNGTVADGFTFAASPNPYSFAREPSWLVRNIPVLKDTIFAFESPKRIDYLLFRRPDAVKVAPRTCEVVFDRAYKDDLFVSDHFGVATEFGQIVKEEPPSGNRNDGMIVLREHSDEAMRDVEWYQKKHKLEAAAGLVLGFIAWCAGCDAEWAVGLAGLWVGTVYSAILCLMQHREHARRTFELLGAHILLLVLVNSVGVYNLGFMQFVGCMALGLGPAFACTHFLIGLHFDGELRTAVHNVYESNSLTK